MKHHEYTKLWPMLEGTELIKLTEDIRVHGLRMSILTYNGEILDGRNRERACKAAGIEPHYEEAPASTDEEALDLVVSLNEHRRHLTLAQRAFAAEKLATLHGAGRPVKTISSPELIKTTETKCLNAAADRLKVSHGSAKRARDIRNHGTDADVEEVLTGKTTLNAKAESLRNKARTAKKAAPSKSPPRPEPRTVFSSAGPARDLTMQEVEPGFTGTATEFTDKYGHYRSSTAAERSRAVFITWTGVMRGLMKMAKDNHSWPNGQSSWPSDAPHWIEHLDTASEHEIAKLAEAIEYLRPKLAFAEALLARAREVTVTQKRA